MRLDKFLKVSRIIKRRTVANEACDTGRVSINGKPAKPSAQVKEGDILSIRMGGKTVSARITSVLETAQKADAASMYELLPEEPL
ncbi:MAG: Heat shock protein 15 [Firmicutes bacterium ADurb.Bin182]|nr:MAG: Heat shock protein 15 [Firmicutes bacterium ADurb.Bin182]